MEIVKHRRSKTLQELHDEKVLAYWLLWASRPRDAEPDAAPSRLARPVAHSGLFPHPIDDCKALIAGLIIAESTGAAVPWGHSLWQFRAISFPLRASAEMTEEVKRPLPVKVPFGLLVFLLIAIGGTVVASRLVAPKKGVAC